MKILSFINFRLQTREEMHADFTASGFFMWCITRVIVVAFLITRVQLC